MKQFDAQANVQPASVQYSASATYQAQTHEDQFRVPMYKALFAGGAITVLTAVVVGALLWIANLILAPAIPLAVYGFAALLVFGIGAWQTLANFQEYEQSAVWILEQMIKRDVDGDGEVGNPTSADVARVTVHLNSYQAVHGELPFVSQHKALAEGLLSGVAFSRRAWCPNSWGVTLSQDDFDDLQKAFVATGLATWKNEEYHQVGAVLSLAGVEYCEKQTGRKASAELLKKLGLPS